MPSLHALFVLFWALVRSVVARAMGAGRGLKEFRESYAADRLPSATLEERAALPSMSGCIACGLCDLGTGVPEGAGPMDLALASSRASFDADAAVVHLAKLPDAVLARREAICPTRVPLVAIARLTRARAKATEAVAPIG